MKISSAEEYAVRAMVFLARQHESQEAFSISEIARQESLPVSFLEQLFRQLKKHDLVIAQRGTSGGYVLARQPQEISARDIIEAVSGPIDLFGCQDMRHCSKDRCTISPLWARLTARIAQTLQEANLNDLKG